MIDSSFDATGHRTAIAAPRSDGGFFSKAPAQIAGDASLWGHAFVQRPAEPQAMSADNLGSRSDFYPVGVMRQLFHV